MNDGIVGFTPWPLTFPGNTEYVAAYKGDECLFYQEEVQPGSSPFDEDVTCRGSAWAGNVTLEVRLELYTGVVGCVCASKYNHYRWCLVFGVVRQQREDS